MSSESLERSSQRSIKRLAIKIAIIVSVVVGISYGVYYYIEKTPHCQFTYDGNISYSCDMFASSLEKQNMCIEDSLMNSPSTGYNADTGKSYVLSDKEKKDMYNFIVESCK